MKEIFKGNFAIVLAFILPIVFIIVVALNVYLPSFFISTDYNFVYLLCTDSRNYYPYQCDKYMQERYSVINNKLVVNDIDPAQDSDNNGTPDINENYIVRIFLHDTKKNESREITLKEAQTLSLSSLLTSPDGVTVSRYYHRSGGDFFFIFGGGRSSYGYYLTKGNSRRKLNIINRDDRYYYRNNFRFIGWVLSGRN